MATRKTKKRKGKPVKPEAECPCDHGVVCEQHPDKPFEHDDCPSEGTLCTNPNCTKDPDSFFVAVHDCSLDS